MKYFYSLIFVLFASATMAQHTNFNTQRNWSLNKKEVLFGIGATNFLGDLGGRDMIGTDHHFVDLDWPSTGIGGMVGFRYRFHPFFATTTTLNVGMVRADDAHTAEVIRNSRNLHFRSLLVEVSQRLDIILFAVEKYGSRYSLRGHKSRMKDKNFQFYLFGGIGVAYFNPKAQYNGKWTALRPLHTEGQGLDGGPSEYLPITVTIPYGAGIRFGISKMWRIGLELSHVRTFTDYMDDVSGSYYDPTVLEANYGAEAAYLSNPANNNASWFAAGQQRGDKKHKDSYFYANVVVYRNITYKNYAGGNRKTKWRGNYKF